MNDEPVNPTHNADGIPYGLTYPQMVKDLFKVDIPGNGSALLHAAIGMSGEVGELGDSANHGNFVEELGDLRFYIEAAWQLMPPSAQASRADALRKLFHPGGKFTPIATFDILMPALVSGTAAFLDITKKTWVYNRAPDYQDLFNNLVGIEGLWAQACEFSGVEMPEIMRKNMVKLVSKNGGRYASGTYSDVQAQKRADKAAGE